MELRSFLLKKGIRQVDLVRVSDRVGLRIHAPHLSNVVHGKKVGHKFGDNIRKALSLLGVPDEDIAKIDNLKPENLLRRNARQKSSRHIPKKNGTHQRQGTAKPVYLCFRCQQEIGGI